jgi:hypothetical protein
MALTRQTMTDEQRKSVALEYLKAFDKAGVTSDGGSVLELFAEDAQVYFPKWELADGREATGRLFPDVGGTLKGIVHLHRAIWFGEYRVVAPMKSQRRVVSRGSGKRRRQVDLRRLVT